MDQSAITSTTVRDCLRAIRFGKPLENGPLFDLTAVRDRVRRERIDPTSEMAAWIVADVLQGVVEGEWRRVRTQADVNARDGENDEWAMLSADFSVGNISLEAWSILRYRYFGLDERQLAEVAEGLAVSTRTLTRRLTRGHQLLAEALVQRDDSNAGSPDGRSGLPDPGTSFIGRERDVAALRSLIAQHRLVTLTGMGGIGKSRLALHVAREVAWSYRDGLAFVDLSAVDHDEGVHSAMLGGLDVAESVGHSVMDAIVRHLEGCDLLLVIDNCEQVLTTVGDMVTHLLNRCGRLTIVATSRTPVGCPREHVYPVRGLAVPPDGASVPTGRERMFDAVRLFLERTRRVGWAADDTPSTAARITRICRELDGIPLAIELAASHAVNMPLERIEADLADRFDLLAGDSGALRRQHAAMRTVLAMSTRKLDPSAAGLLGRLTVFRGGWTAEAAEEVCADDTIQPGDVPGLTQRLVDRSLVEKDVGHGSEDGVGVRFRMLRTVRAYAERHLLDADSVATLRDRHLTHFTQVAGEAIPGLRGPDQDRVLRGLDDDASNLRAAITHALRSNNTSDGLRLTGSLTVYWWIKGRATSGRALTEAMLAKDATGRDTEERALALSAAGNLASVQGDLGEARRYLEEGLQICERLELHERKIGILNGLANVLSSLGDSGVALERYREALTIADQAGRDQAAVGLRENIAILLTERGDPEEAIPYLREVLAHHDRVGGAMDRAHVLRNLAVAEWYSCRFEDAQLHTTRALEIARELDAKPQIANLLQLVFNLAMRRGDLLRAETAMRESIDLFRTIDDPKQRIMALSNRGWLHLLQGDASAALAASRASLDEASSGTPNPELMAFALRGMADAHMHRGALEKARDCLRRGLEQHQLVDQQRSLDGRQLTSFALLAAHMGELEIAGRLANVATDLIGEDLLPGQMRSEWRIESVRERIAAEPGADAARRALNSEQAMSRDDAFELARGLLDS